MTGGEVGVLGVRSAEGCDGVMQCGAGAHEPVSHPSWIRNAAASCLTRARHSSAGRVLVWRVFQHNIELICKLIN